jgi:hypothetical protein
MFSLSIMIQLSENIDLHSKYTLETTKGAIKNGQSRGTGNIGHTRHRRKTNKTIQHRKLKRSATRTPPKIEGEPRCSRMVPFLIAPLVVSNVYLLCKSMFSDN